MSEVIFTHHIHGDCFDHLAYYEGRAAKVDISLYLTLSTYTHQPAAWPKVNASTTLYALHNHYP